MSFKATITVDLDDREAVLEAIAGLQRVLGLAPAETATAPAGDPPEADRGESPTTPRASTSTPSGSAPASQVDAAAAELKRRERQGAGPARGQRGLTRQRILDFIRSNPRCTTQEIANEVQISKGGISTHLAALSKAGQVNSRREGKGKIYLPAASDGGMLEADENGAKTGQERKIVECLIEARIPLTSEQIATRTKIHEEQVTSICAGLCRRRALSQLSPETRSGPTRWQPIRHPKTMSDRAAV